ncbi:MAG: alpha/beta hydrolase [Myxococcales bacterium]|nr:alpha/beta hydrolase [Myxococcales bacterium]
MTPLAHRVVGPDAGPTAFILHGILGQAGNLGGLARSLATRHPTWRFVLPDLRGHGASPSGEPPHTVAACADDLAALAAEVGAPQVVIGHSFGGKVALVYARTYGVDDAWVLDAPPGAADPGVDHEVPRVIAATRALAPPFASREAVTAHFLDRGFGTGIAAWMTTNVARTAAGLVWKPDLDVVEALLADYFRTDLWDFLAAPGATRVHLLRAGRSDRWDAATLTRLATLPIDVHVLPDAGHWVHVDDPAGLQALLDVTLSRR